MFEVRCPKCQKKLAELGRKPLALLSFSKLCSCGKEIKANISVNDTRGEIIASLTCPCGYKNEKIAGYVVSVKCRKCKTVTRF